MAVWRRIVRFIAAGCVFALAAALPLRPASAYEYEHYGWTYFIALHFGFTERQAYQLASAAFAIDWAENTGPMPHGLIEEIQGAAGAASEVNMRVKWRNFHAFFALDTLLDARAAGKTPAEVDAIIKAELDGHLKRLYALGMRQENVGAYIHFLQDTYSHGGFGDMFGHGAASHLPDFMSWDPQKSRAMTIATFYAIVGYYKDLCASYFRDYCKDRGAFRYAPDMNVLQPVLDRLLAANPVPVEIDKPQQLMRALKEYSTIFEQNPFTLRQAGTLATVLTGLQTMLVASGARHGGGIVSPVWWLKGMPAPDFPRVHTVIVNAIRAAKAADPNFVKGFSKPEYAALFPKFSTDLPYDWFQFNFDKSGAMLGLASLHELEDLKLTVDNPSVVVEQVGDNETGVFRVTAKLEIGVDGMAPLPFQSRLPLVVESQPANLAPRQLTATIYGGHPYRFEQVEEWPVKDVAGKKLNWDLGINLYSLPAVTRTIEVSFPETKASAACNSAVDSGGDEGGGVTVDLGGFVGKAGFSWEMYDIKDEMSISVGGVSKTTGCVSGSGTIEFDIASGMSTATVKVLPNCEATTGTSWQFTFECPLTSEVTADGSGRLLPGTGTSGQTGPAGNVGSTTGSVIPLSPVGAIELEPNGTDILATPIAPSATIEAILVPGGDLDFFSFFAPAGELTIGITRNLPGGALTFGIYPAAGGNWLPDVSPADDNLLVVDLPVSGLYVLRVTSAEPVAADAPYGLTTSLKPSADENEPNSGAPEATPTGLDGSVSGAILPGGDIDFFRIDATAAGQWTIDITALPDANKLALGVYPATGGNWLPDLSPPDDNRLVVDIAAPGPYILQVNDAAGARSPDPYRLGLSFLPTDATGEPNDAPAIATATDGSGAITGSILPGGDIDMLAFDAPAQGEWTITVTDTPPGLTLLLGVYPAAGGNWLPDLGPAGDTTLVVDLPAPGRYLLQVNDTAGARSVMPYAIDLGFIEGTDQFEPNNADTAATPIVIGGPLGGTILPGGDQDLYYFTVPDAGELTIALAGAPPGLNLDFGIYPAAGGNWLPDLSPAGDGRLVVDLPWAGRYILRVTDVAGARSVDPYSVTTAFVAAGDVYEPNNAPPVAAPIAATGTIVGAILPSGDNDHFLVSAPQAGRFSAVIEDLPAGLALSLGVYPAAGGNWLPDQSPPDDGELVVDLPLPGLYVLHIVDAAGARSVAPYTISTSLK